MIKAVVFDLDHTLYDRYATLRKIAAEADENLLPFKCITNRKRLGEIMVEVDKEYVLFGWDKLYEVYSRTGMLKESVNTKEIFKEYLRNLFSLCAVPFEFTEPMLRELKAIKIKIGLLTNGTHWLQSRKIELLGLESFFDEILICGDTPYQKPDVRVFEIMTEKMGFPPKEILYVGDNPVNDVSASRKAGYTPVWVKTSGRWPFEDIEKAEYEVETVAEIPSLVCKINSK